MLIASCGKESGCECEIDGSWSKIDTLNQNNYSGVTLYTIEQHFLSVQDGVGNLEASLTAPFNSLAPNGTWSEVTNYTLEEELNYLPCDSFIFSREYIYFARFNSDGTWVYDTLLTQEEGQYAFRFLPDCERIALPRIISLFGSIAIEGEVVLERD